MIAKFRVIKKGAVVPVSEFKNDELKELIEKQANDIRKMISARGYESLVTSILKLREEGRAEWQIRIDYDPANNDYPVYCLGERASEPNIIPHYKFFSQAQKHFLMLLDTTVDDNRQYISEGRPPEYSSPL